MIEIVKEIKETERGLKMKFSREHYVLVDESIRAIDREEILKFKSYLLAKAERGEVKDFETRFIFSIYYSLPREIKGEICKGSYKDSHVKTAVKRVLQELDLL